MKLKNVRVGMKVQVKENADLRGNWYTDTTGRIGEVLGVDISDNCPVLVLVRFEDGYEEWGGHKGLRKVKGDK